MNLRPHGGGGIDSDHPIILSCLGNSAGTPLYSLVRPLRLRDAAITLRANGDGEQTLASSGVNVPNGFALTASTETRATIS